MSGQRNKFKAASNMELIIIRPLDTIGVLIWVILHVFSPVYIREYRLYRIFVSC